eukprot:1031198-Amphidinium_carterae.1
MGDSPRLLSQTSNPPRGRIHIPCLVAVECTLVFKQREWFEWKRRFAAPHPQQLTSRPPHSTSDSPFPLQIRSDKCRPHGMRDQSLVLLKKRWWLSTLPTSLALKSGQQP